jgi:adenylate cyclase
MNAVLNWIKKHGPVHLVIVAIFTAPIIWLLTVLPSQENVAGKIRIWFDGLEYQTVDTRMYYGRKAEADQQVVLLNIDSACMRGLDQFDSATIAASPALTDMKGGYPFPREVYAMACDRLFGAGAKVVAFDLIFATPSPTDPVLAKALDTYRDKVVVASHFTDDSKSIDVPASSLIADANVLDDRLGFVNYWQDTDGIVRAAQYRNNLEFATEKPNAGQMPKFYSFDARTVQRAGRGDLVPDDFLPRPVRFTANSYPDPPAFPRFSFCEIFDPVEWEKNFDHGNFFRDKIVVIGPDGSFFHDVHPVPPVPNSTLPGAELHLNAINALLHNQFLAPPSNRFSIIIVLIFAGIALLLAALIHSIALRFGVALVLAAIYAAAAMGAYNGPGWLLPIVAPAFVFCGSVGTGFVYDFVVAQLERYRLRLTFERYNSKNVVKYLLANPESYKEMLVGTHRSISVLFSDIRGFTTIVETAPDPRELVRKLNEYLTAMVECVIKQDGNLEKFMGDGIMAVWGNTPYTAGPKDDAIRAVRAALAMTVELKRLNAKWLAEGRSEWKIGIGVNHGNVIVGDMGSPEHKEFAMVGDPVNLGSRLEGLTKEYHVPIMLGEQIAELVTDVFFLRSVARVQVKGRTHAVKTFTVLGEKKDGLPPQKEKFLRLHEEAMAAFWSRDFERAGALFNQALELEPEDFLATEYRKSALLYAQQPPPADWDGVRVMTEK